MIHAATMVSAGVYLVIRFYPLMAAGRVDGGLTAPMFAMALIGAFTAIFAATIALTQNDIKRVLAYSTISQLGFMIAALGVGAYVAAVFHLVMHAFFKALLFLGSGSVIHGMEHGAMHSGDEVDPQDMFHMGGLFKKMPLTFWTFLAGGLSLAGFPYITAGFWSKDEILSGAFGGGFMAVFITLAVAAFVTAFYTMRQITLVFLGKPRTKAATSASETSLVMTIPLIVLAVFAIAAGWSAGWFKPFVGSMILESAVENGSLVPLFTSLSVSLLGLLSGWLVYRGYEVHQPDPLKTIIGPFYTLFKNKYWIDEFYEKAFVHPAAWVADVLVSRWIDKVVLDGILNGIGLAGLAIGRFLRNIIDMPVINRGFEFVFGQSPLTMGNEMKRSQTGRVQEYIIMAMIVMIVVGIVVILVVPI
jgi:NADH-quinone oxidoreductase subunit L